MILMLCSAPMVFEIRSSGETYRMIRIFKIDPSQWDVNDDVIALVHFEVFGRITPAI